MGKLERITVTMPEEMAAKLRAAVDAGEYATTSEIVRETVRTWADERDREQAENAAMRLLLERARASGMVPAEEVYARVRAHVAKVAEEELARRGEA